MFGFSATRKKFRDLERLEKELAERNRILKTQSRTGAATERMLKELKMQLDEVRAKMDNFGDDGNRKALADPDYNLVRPLCLIVVPVFRHA